MLSLFFISIGMVSASDVSDNKDFNSEDINDSKIQNIKLYADSDYLDKTSYPSNQSNSITSINDSYDESTTQSTNSLSSVINTSDDNLVTSSSVNSSATNNNLNNNSLNKTTVNDTKINDSTKTSNSNSKKTLAAGGDEKPAKLTQNQVITAAKSVYKYARANKVLPNYVTIGGYKFSMPEFLYLMSKTIGYKSNGIYSSIAVKYGVKNPKSPSGVTIKAKMSTKYYYKYAKAIYNYISTNGIAPNYVSTSWGKMQYQTAIYAFSKILSTGGSGKLTKSLSLTVSRTQKLNKYFPKYSNGASGSEESKEKVPSSRLNSKYNGESLTKYLSASKNCQSNDAKIIAMAKKLTKNCKTELEKATAIFNAVRDKVSYSFYYNTKKGAKKTMDSKSGNCVDKTHLLISLLRAVDIPARYANGEAKFTSGNTYGHVWAQVLIGDTWVVADTTSSRNNFGVVNNWYPSTAKIYGYYSSISF